MYMSSILAYIKIPASQYHSMPLEEPKQNVTAHKVEYCAVIFLHLKGNKATIHAELVEVYSNSAPSYDTVVRWRRCFQCGEDPTIIGQSDAECFLWLP